MSDYALSELLRRMERMVVVTTVVVLDRAGARAKVKWGDGAESDWLAIAQLGSVELPVWFPPSVGTQVVVLSPGGDTTKGIVYPGPFSGPVPAGNFVGSIVGTGEVTLTGNVTVAGDVVASGVSLTTHTHGGVISGGSNTSGPS
ncbi:phage baseplate assembly protein V [Falsihalocynthiibacter sp. S25ZX9]|uniref:phage baseplate assembly protein V n=1 Tax=Falsihalocynthiibacter sp. S25ZX9 TaxID=3240870 RepID=UPI0035100B1E